MTHKESEIIFDEIYETIKQMRGGKGYAYAFNEDTFYNIREGARRRGISEFEYLRALQVKHEISIDIAIKRNPEMPEELTESIEGRVYDELIYWFMFLTILRAKKNEAQQ
jgi:hypothetical protein